MNKFFEIVKEVFNFIKKAIVFIWNVCVKCASLLMAAVKTPAVTVALLSIYFFVANVFSFSFGKNFDTLIFAFNMILALLSAKLLTEDK